jgi:FkbH-like protein
MSQAVAVEAVANQAAEPVRLVIWDLDDVFWNGTLSEEGMTWRPESAEAVVELSRRGIINAICSKNDLARVEAVLQAHGLRDYFVFPSVDWSPKGPRLAALVAQVQLRPETILFIDDNPMNRAEARHFVPGLQIADETILPRLLDDPRLRGKPDPDMTRLAQYRILEQRQSDQQRAGTDQVAFLRDSGITVSINFDLAPHLDRAIELINRTNQLNFTKSRLPEDPEAARGALRALLGKHTVNAGLVHVRDRYGDYGYCGIYIARNDRSGPVPELLHFAFSCRILGMGIETWLYRHLNRPRLRVRGEVLADVIADRRDIDWVRMELPGVTQDAAVQPRVLAYVLARGGCDMRAMAHYLDMVACRVVEEIAGVRDGMSRLTCGSVIAAHAIHGVPPALVRDAAPLGFAPEDFASVIAAPPAESPAIWLLNFTLERSVPVLRHKETGALLPAWILGIKGGALQMLRADPARSGLDPALVAHLREKFDMLGVLPDEIFEQNLRLILKQAPPDVRVFILLANEQGRDPDGTPTVLAPMQQRNRHIAAVTRDFPAVELLAPRDFMSAAEMAALETPHHYDRVVYFRMFQHVMRRVQGA